MFDTFFQPERSAFSLLFLVAASCSSATLPDAVVPEYVDCTVFPDSRIAAYVLPYAVGQEFRVSRTFTHYTPGNGGVGLYAVDIPMPVGAAVHAIRGGVVVAVEESFLDTDREDYHENFVMIRHADSTIARYMHLTTSGVLVQVGDPVAQGQQVGWSGNSGPSTAPHLHLDVQTCGPNLPPAYNTKPCGMTVPLSFSNTAAQSCGLTPGQRYRAQPFVRREL